MPNRKSKNTTVVIQNPVVNKNAKKTAKKVDPTAQLVHITANWPLGGLMTSTSPGRFQWAPRYPQHMIGSIADDFKPLAARSHCKLSFVSTEPITFHPGPNAPSITTKRWSSNWIKVTDLTVMKLVSYGDRPQGTWEVTCAGVAPWDADGQLCPKPTSASYMKEGAIGVQHVSSFDDFETDSTVSSTDDNHRIHSVTTQMKRQAVVDAF